MCAINRGGRCDVTFSLEVLSAKDSRSQRTYKTPVHGTVTSPAMVSGSPSHSRAAGQSPSSSAVDAADANGVDDAGDRDEPAQPASGGALGSLRKSTSTSSMLSNASSVSARSSRSDARSPAQPRDEVVEEDLHPFSRDAVKAQLAAKADEDMQYQLDPPRAPAKLKKPDGELYASVDWSK